MLQISGIRPKENYVMEIFLNNNSSVSLDLSVKLHTARFAGLKNPGIFESATTDGRSVRWTEFMEISISEIFDIAASSKDRFCISKSEETE